MRRAHAFTGLSLVLALATPAVAPGTGTAADATAPRDDRSVVEKMRDRVEGAKEKLAGDDKNANRDPIRAAQASLQERGYDAGDPDGKLGPKTRVAIRKFQQAEGLEVTGRLDAETMRRLQAGKHENRPSASPATERSAPPKR